MTDIVRTPLFFGPPERSLFGWYHAPMGERRNLAVVVCPPMGHEYVNSHRSLRHLADALASAGLPALRFDYDGSGNAAGSDEDPSRVDAWLASIRVAIDEAKVLSGERRVALVGLRVGATLAALAADGMDVASLVLWSPCVRGRSYVRELRALHLTGAARKAPADGHLQPGGFIVTPDTQECLSGVNLETLSPPAPHVLLVQRNDLPSDDGLRTAWSERGARVEQIVAPGTVEMFEPPHNAVVPREAIDHITNWLAAHAPERMPARPIKDTRSAHRYAGLVETVLRDDAEQGFFGILTEAASPRDPNSPTIVLPNAGSTHTVGPNRLYVQLARDLARRGFPVLRIDLPGLGDKIASDPALENIPYPPSASQSIGRALAVMQQSRAARSFVLMGLCSGAHAAFHAALDLDGTAITHCVMINPLTFYYKLGARLDQPTSNHYEEWQRYMRSMRSFEGWAKLFRDDVKISEIARNVARRAKEKGAARLRQLRERFGKPAAAPSGDDLDRDLRRVAAAHRRLSFVFSRYDPGYDLLMLKGGRAVKELRKRGMLDVWRVDDANHTFEARHSREEMIASLGEHLRRVYEIGGAGVDGVRRAS